jgi:acetoin utilization protein AcuB
MTTMRHDPIDPSRFVHIERSVPPAPPARVADRMTQPAVTIGWHESVAHAARLMDEHHIRHLPVVDPGQHLVGIVTDGDLSEALAAEGLSDASAAPPTLCVGKVMTWTAVAVSPACELAEAVTLMHERTLSALPVVEDGRVVGILTESDILRAFAQAIA